MQSKVYIEELKLAVINKDLHKIEKLSKTTPPIFDTLQESQEALALLQEVQNILKEEQTTLSKQMKILRDTKKYIQ